MANLSLRTLTAVAALLATVLLAGAVLAFASAQPASAQDQTCAEGTTLSTDGTTCVPTSGSNPDDNVTTTTSCLEGVLSEDGLYCIVPRLDAAPAAAGDSPTEAPIPSFTG